MPIIHKIISFNFGLSFFGSLLWAFGAFAQDVATPPVSEPSLIERLTSIFGSVTDVISTHPYVALGAGVVVELLGRLAKSDKPLGVIAGVGRMLGGLGGLFLALDALIGKVVPQRLNPPAK